MIVKIYPNNPNTKQIEVVTELLGAGGVVIYPTDTVYGIGCDIHNAKAVERVAAIKQMKSDKRLFSFICKDLSHLSEYAAPVSNSIFKLMKRHLPGPFTFILKAGGKTPRLLEGKKKTVGIRIPSHPVTRAILEAFGRPILSTSVPRNEEAIEYSTDPELINEQYGQKVDMVVDGGYGGIEYSTVVDCTGDEPVIIRQGAGILEY